jgi:3-deoxy-D-manno-octulosonic-acid transferase
MTRSPRLAADASGFRVAATIAAERPVRPPGPLVWLHGTDGGTAGALVELGRRLATDDGVTVLITGIAGGDPVSAGVIHQPLPAEVAPAVRSFLDHWRPDAWIISDGNLPPVLLAEALARRVPVAVVNGRAPQLPHWWQTWWPGLLRGLTAPLEEVFALDQTAHRAFRRAGVAEERIVVTGRMEEAGVVLPAVEADRQAIAAGIGTRPVWFAASVPQTEERAVLEAHKAAQQLAHRLLLIIAPEDPDRCEGLAQALAEDNGWVVASRTDAGEPDGETDIYIVNGTSEYGLWYRLAPVSFLGGSLSPEGSRRNPFEVAALGSAIIHGPVPGPYGARFGRLGAALATRPVAGPADLVEALGELLSPDRAARLAGAAWGVTSAGAEVMDRAMDLVRRMLDKAR